MPLTHPRLWKALDAAARREGLSASGLAKRAGLDATAFNPSKRFGPGDPPRPRWPSTESLTRVLEVTGLSLAEFAELAEDAPRPKRSVPMLGLAQAGLDGFFDASGFPTGDGWDAVDLPAPTPGLFGLTIQGDSMAPLYREGDRVLVDREGPEPRRGDRVVVCTTGGETVAKELLSLTARAATLGSINPAYPPRTLPRRDIDWLARIQWVSQ
ncbi:peptidase S24 [Brevundimonas sp. Leaf363]|uniref:S24 family peptidase n=1 Tax=Brevundimonas sp. Leaf363 TaxID=1736353 RepID=UPI0006F59CCE|nr:helix-turn-helix transcriptional regulator [Brevundimonas sp. Leaf363]KQS55749.1 peptidase S24 [Brevundimonas sp. Leaf363]